MNRRYDPKWNRLRRISSLLPCCPLQTSCFAFKTKDADVTEVAEKLRVNHLVDGSFRKSGDKLRVAVQLIETSSDTHLWSECYDENLNEIFSMQENISKRICDALKTTLHEKDAPNPTTEDPPAYDYYLRGLGFFTAKGSADIGQKDKAHEWIGKALEIAPGDSATRYNVGCFYAEIGDLDKAFANLKQSITSRSWVESDPSLDPLRDDPRFSEYLKRSSSDWMAAVTRALVKVLRALRRSGPRCRAIPAFVKLRPCSRVPSQSRRR